MFRRHRYAAPAASKTAFRPSEEPRPVSTTSGDPRNLNQFLEGSGPLRGQLTESARSAVSAVQAFVATGSVARGGVGGPPGGVPLPSGMGGHKAGTPPLNRGPAGARPHRGR